MATTAKFNNGNLTSNTIERQFKPENVLKAVIEYPKAKRPFSKLVSAFAMPRNHGDTVTQEIRHGMMAEDNVMSGGIDASHATLAIGIIYSNNNNVFRVEEYLAANNHDWNAALENAKTDAENDGGIKEYSPDGIIYGKSGFAAYQGEILPLPEEGGVLNGFIAKSSLVSAKLSWHMIHTKYTERSEKLDSRVGMIARHISDLGDVLAEAKEGQLQASLQKQANTRRMISTTNAAVVTASDIDGMDVLTYETLEQLGIQLQDNRVPMDTELVIGVDLQDTVTIGDGYIMFINRAVVPTLTRIVGPGGVLAWKDKKHYAAGTTLIEGEVGSLDGLPFRFVVVDNLQVEKGAGEVVGANNDNGDGDAASVETQTASFKTYDKVNDQYNYDVYSGLVVGADSFSITGFGYNSTKAVHVPPKRDVYNDLTASVGAVVADWSYAFLCTRPERIMKVSFNCIKSGAAPIAA